ncbi:MAG: DUF493 domain-containing protein [Zetaproteobacteria bacterium]|nr:DUF493 domain-containing protein [Zetaproteobacteria bacterium]
MSIEQPSETLLTFPCTFPIKIMGIASDTFEATMIALAGQYIEDMETVSIQQKASKNGTYTSITMTFEAQSQTQLDALYRDFSAHPSVKMVL